MTHKVSINIHDVGEIQAIARGDVLELNFNGQYPAGNSFTLFGVTNASAIADAIEQSRRAKEPLIRTPCDENGLTAADYAHGEAGA